MSVTDRVIAACVTGSVLLAGWSLYRATAAKTERRGYQVGDVIEPELAQRLDVRGDRLLVWVSLSCAVCDESADQYARIAAAAHQTSVVVVGRDPLANINEFVSSKGIDADRVVSTDGNTYRLRAFPTVLAIDGSGVVTSVWVGRIGEDDERKLIAAVN